MAGRRTFRILTSSQQSKFNQIQWIININTTAKLLSTLYSSDHYMYHLLLTWNISAFRPSTQRPHSYIYTECPRRNVPDFGRVFLMLKYTDITQNTYIQSWTVTETMAREKWGFLAVTNTASCTADTSRDSANVLDSGMQCSLCLRDALRSQPCYVTAGLSHV